MFKKLDWQLFIVIGLIIILGLVALLSTTIDQTGNFDLGGVFVKQILFVLIGFVIAFITSRLDMTYFKHFQLSFLFYIIILILLVITLFFGVTINQAKRWLIIGGIQIQASELAKIAIILLTASIMNIKTKYNEWILAGLSFIFVIPYVVLIYLQPHGAMAMLMIAMWFLVVFTSMSNQFRNLLLLIMAGSIFLGEFLLFRHVYVISILLIVIGISIFIFSVFSKFQLRKLFIIAILFSIIAGIAMPFAIDKLLLPHQRARIEAFINPSSSSGFNVDQAKVAVGAGQIFGKGFGFGTQSRLRFLPEHQTDFIFAAYAEEFGFIGVMIILALYCFLVYRLLWQSVVIQDNFSRVVIFCIAIKILMEVFINIGTNTGIIPATGIPLPLFSAGGSITLATFFCFGIIQSIINNSEQKIDIE